MRKSTKKVAEAVKPTAAEVVETVKEAVTETAEKAAAKVEKAAETVKKAAETKKDETKEKKAPARKAAAVKEEFFLQFNGKEISQADVMKKVKENWTKVQKKKIKDIKSVSVYMVPESGCAYYVINGEGGDDYRVEL